MRVLMIEAPQAMLDERRRRGEDRRDEMWDGLPHFRHADDYRVPDQAVYRPDQVSEHGLEGAELVIEIRQDWDQTYEKLDFYARVGVQELLVLHPRPRRVDLFIERGGRMLPVQTDRRLHSDVLGMWMHVEDDELVLPWDGGGARI
jgi:hypothetical protein